MKNFISHYKFLVKKIETRRNEAASADTKNTKTTKKNSRKNFVFFILFVSSRLRGFILSVLCASVVNRFLYLGPPFTAENAEDTEREF